MKKYMDVRVTACCEEDLASIIRLFAYISECGRMGAGKSFNVIVDGDGSGRYKFEPLWSNTFFDQIEFTKDAKKNAQKEIKSNKPIKIYLGE